MADIGGEPYVRKFLLGDGKYEPGKCGLAFAFVDRYVGSVQKKVSDQKIDGRIVAYIEWPVVARGGARTTIVQSFVNGAIQACLVNLGITTYHVTPSEWKLALLGKGRGNAGKEDVAVVLGQRWSEAWAASSGDGDCIDAAAIAIYGRDIQSRGRRLMDGVGPLQGPGAPVLQPTRTRSRVQRRVRNRAT